MAVLQGMAVAVPLAIASVPLGLLADRISRVRILITSVVVALLGLVLSALAPTFALLFAARCLIGIATPGIVVAAYSMASDLVSPSQRGRATMTVAIGEIGGAPVAFALGGALLVMTSTHPGMKLATWGLADWRWALLWMSTLLMPVLLLLLCVREPPRMEAVAERLPLRTVLPQLWRIRATAVPLQLGRAILFIADGAVYVWGAPLFARNFHLSPDRIGSVMGVALLVSGVLGPVFGGALVDLCQRHGGSRRAVLVLAVIALISTPFALFAVLPSAAWAAALLAAFLTLGIAIASAALALILVVIPGELRGLNVGMSLVVGSLFFMGLAPLGVSGLSGVLGGEAKIGEALAIVCATASLLTAIVFAISARHFPSKVAP